MTNSLFIEGKLHAPYFVFLRCTGRYSDEDLLDRFGLLSYRPTRSVRRHGPYAILADDGEWTMIADDWYYTLWHLKTTRPALEVLAESCDVFACSVGDCDHSFDFVYYRDSHLVRRYVVADPDFRGGSIVENVGEPLPGESTAFEQTDEMNIVLNIAASLGIKIDYSDRDIRVYAPSDGQS